MRFLDYYDTEDIVIGSIIVLVVAGIVALVGGAIYTAVYYRCVKTQLVHRPGWTQIVVVDKSIIPIYHPGYEAEECAQYEEK